MHLGNVFAALMSYASVKHDGGRWLLRMEDLDRQRCREEYSEQIIDDLLWLGLRPDEGAGVGGDHGPYWQSQRDAFYDRAFASLKSEGLTYECFCKRADLLAASAPHASDGHTLYALTCFGMDEERKAEMRAKGAPAWRLHLPDENSFFVDGHYGIQRANLADDRGDIIVRRADGNYAYQLAVVVDDALMGVTEVVRAVDLLQASHEQSFLFRALGYTPPSFSHIPLLLAPDGSRLSKRDRSLAMDRIRGLLKPEELIGLIAHLAHLAPTWRPMKIGDFVEAFSWSHVPTEDIVVDAQELGLNRAD